MQAQRQLPLGQKGAKKLLEHYGGQLFCARIRDDEQRCKCLTTVEITVKESGWFTP
jgi:hypothetical protein